MTEDRLDDFVASIEQAIRTMPSVSHEQTLGAMRHLVHDRCIAFLNAHPEIAQQARRRLLYLSQRACQEIDLLQSHLSQDMMRENWRTYRLAIRPTVLLACKIWRKIAQLSYAHDFSSAGRAQVIYAILARIGQEIPEVSEERS